jgi:AraC-like DNA-binding protein
MNNAEITGGLVVDGVRIEEDSAERESARIRQSAFLLQKMAEEANLTNAAHLELRRREADRESRRAEAIHELKGRAYDSIREIYLREEAGLMAAIRRGDRSEARAILNRILVGIYFFGRGRQDLLKSFILELVVSMSRSAVEAGADPAGLLGANYSSLARLSRIEGEEELTRWLVDMLERIMDSIRTHRRYPQGVLLNAALAYIGENLGGDVSRDQAARVACMSPSHFSRVVRERFGMTFTSLVAQMRVDRARELLKTSEMNLAEIALECGFPDQSYFTKVFRRIAGCTPSEYRQRERSGLR